MADEADGIEEVFEHSARVALTAGGLMAERIARAREQAHREAEAASEQEARELQKRLDAERSAARASLAPVDRDDWWERATPDEIGDAWQTANAWRDIDADAQRTADTMRDELRQRYDFDVDNLGADPGAVREALERRERAHQMSVDARKDVSRELTTAQLLTREDSGAERSAAVYSLRTAAKGPDSPTAARPRRRVGVVLVFSEAVSGSCGGAGCVFSEAIRGVYFRESIFSEAVRLEQPVVGHVEGLSCPSLTEQRPYAGARCDRRVATTSRISSQSTSLKLCIGQNFGPHIEQNSADLK